MNANEILVLLVRGSTDAAMMCQPVLDGVTLSLKNNVFSLGVLLNLDSQLVAAAWGVFVLFQLVGQLCPFQYHIDLIMVIYVFLRIFINRFKTKAIL